MAPVSSSTRFLSAQAQSSVEYSARVHKATLLESAMSLTNGQLRPPRSCGRASVARSTMGRRLLPSTSFHKKRRQKDYDTWCSQVVSNPSTNQARRGLTSLIRREVVLSSWYGRNSFLFSFSAAPFWLSDKRRMVCVMSNKHTKVALLFLCQPSFSNHLFLLVTSPHSCPCGVVMSVACPIHATNETK